MKSIRNRFGHYTERSGYLVAGAEVHRHSKTSDQVSALRARKCP